jgi:putative MATE family efflux protein
MRRASEQDRQILRLAVPAFVALVSEPLFLLADSAVVGHLGTAQLAALGIAGAVVQTVVGLFVFLAYATTASVARNLGAGDQRAALIQGIDGLWLALAIGLISAACVSLLVDPIVSVFGPSESVASYAHTYLRIALLGVPSLLLLLAATGVLRGLQDTRTPLAVVVTANLANIGLNVMLVYGADLGIAGSAWGSVLAQTGGAIALVAVVVRAARRTRAPVRPSLAGLRASAGAGLALTVRTLTLRAALLISTYVATSQGDTAIATHQIAATVWTTLAFALDAIAIAGQALTGRFLGAGDVAGARAATRRMISWGIGTGLAFGGLLAVSSPFLGRLFTGDREIWSLLTELVLVAAVFQPVAGVVFVLDGILIGAGDGRYLAGAGALTLLAYAPLAWLVLVTDAGLTWLWVAFGGFMFARMLTLVVRERSDAWLITGPTSRLVKQP